MTRRPGRVHGYSIVGVYTSTAGRTEIERLAIEQARTRDFGPDAELAVRRVGESAPSARSESVLHTVVTVDCLNGRDPAVQAYFRRHTSGEMRENPVVHSVIEALTAGDRIRLAAANRGGSDPITAIAQLLGTSPYSERVSRFWDEHHGQVPVPARDVAGMAALALAILDRPLTLEAVMVLARRAGLNANDD